MDGASQLLPQDPHERRRLAVLLVLATLTRVVYLAVKWPGFTRPGMEYEAIADAWLEHGALLFNHYGTPLPTAYMPPGVIGVLVVAKSLFGEWNRWPIAALHLALGTGAGWLLYGLTRRLAEVRAAELALALYAVDANLLIPIAWLNETLYTTFFVLLYLVCTFALLERPTVARAALLGLVFGTAVLFRSTLIGHLAVVLVFVSWRLRGSSQTLHVPAVVAIVFALTLSPWTVRNWRVFHRVIPVSQNLGNNLWQGWSPESGSSEYALDGSPLVMEPALVEQLRSARTESEINDILVTASVRYAKEDPARWLAQRVRAFLFFWHEHNFWAPKSPYRTTGWLALGFVNLFLVAAFFAAAIMLVRRPGDHRLVLAILATHAAIHAITHADIGSRFRYQVEPLMLLVIAWAAVGVWRRRRTSA